MDFSIHGRLDLQTAKINLVPNLKPYTKIKSRRITDQSVKDSV